MPPNEPRWRPLLSASAVRGIVDRAADRRPVEVECARLLVAVHRQCPGLLPEKPLKAGSVAKPVELKHDEARQVMRLGFRAAAGARDADSVLWQKGDLQLLVHIAQIEIGLDDGSITVNIPVECDETGRTSVTVIFAVGSSRRAAGALAVTEDRPRGPVAIVTLWSDEIIALAWHGVMEGVLGVAGAAGEDEDGAALIPATFSVTANNVTVQPMARHTFDRIRR
jgi:hypothetical protein